MKIFVDILYWLLFLLLLIIVIILVGGIIFNTCDPRVKGMSRLDFELLSVLILSIYGMLAVLYFLRK